MSLSTESSPKLPILKTEPTEVEAVVIRFSGDSGDGMQLTGTQFTSTAAIIGNDIATFPDFPAEIRAPAGTTFGVSGFQINFSSQNIHTPGDHPSVLVAMNPAALKVNLADVESGGTLIVNSGAFTKSNLTRAGYTSNPLEDGTLDGHRLFALDISTLVAKALEETGLSHKEIGRAKNFWTLGLLYYLYNKPLDTTMGFIDSKFRGKDTVAEGNRLALKAGYAYGEATEAFQETYRVRPADLGPGTYRNISGNQSLAWGALAAAQQAGLKLFLGSYPITPASDILHELSKYKHFGALTFQAEDEIAAVCAAIGAAFAGKLAMTTTSGPGVALKSEAIGLGVSVELPMVVVNVQRGGPSTGLPTKTEQSDLFQAMYGRNGDCPVPIVAPSTPGDCFYAMMEAARIALKYMVPTFLLSDGYLANGAEPWVIPTSLPNIDAKFHEEAEGFSPFQRDPKTLARIWPLPGTPGLEHRVGGLEKDYETGNISYEPGNHEKMVHVRQAKIDGIQSDIPKIEPYGSPNGGALLVLGWGSTYGTIRQAVDVARGSGKDVSHAHLRHLNPFPANLGDVLASYDKVLIPEMNMGQLWTILRAKYLVDAISFSKVQGKPFKVWEIVKRIEGILEQ